MSNIKKFMQEVGVSSEEELANLFEMTAAEFSDSDHTEVARDYMFSAGLIRENEKLRKAIADCYMLSVRRGRGITTPENQDWKHIEMFCEQAGMKFQILRDAVPTK